MPEPQLTNPNASAAIALAAQGWRVFPCRPDKKPFVGEWAIVATCAPDQIEAWWAKWPNALPAIPCGPNRLFVVDQDRHGRADGVAAWRDLCERNGLNEAACLIVETPSGGRHTYFRQPDALALGNSAGRIASSIDTRGDGGYVIAPGATLPDGRSYRAVSGSLAGTPVVPRDLYDFLAGKPAQRLHREATEAPGPRLHEFAAHQPTDRERAYAQKAVEAECERVRRAPEGQRNETLNSAAFSIAQLIPHFGVGSPELQRIADAAHSAGLEHAEVNATISSALAAAQQRPRAPLSEADLPPIDLDGVKINGSPIVWASAPIPVPMASDQSNRDQLVIRRVSEVAATPLEWLWHPRIALGKLTIIAGDPGLGKSQLTAFLAARVTTGGRWPNADGFAPAGNVIMLSCEDDIADTIRPRLEAAGADPERVHVIEAVRTGKGQIRGFSLTQDLAQLEYALARVSDVRLVIVDPITAYLTGADTHKTGDVRAALAPLQELASRYRVAVVAVSHFNKSAGYGKSINAITGSNAFVAASRATFIVAKDADNPARRLFVESKNNLAQAAGLAFRVEGIQLPNGISAPRVVFEDGTVDMTADQAIGEPQQQRKRSARDEAADFLKALLADGEVPAKTVLAEAKEVGIAEKTLRRTAGDIGVIIRKGGYQGEWMWGFGMAPTRVAALFGDGLAKDGQHGQSSALENRGIFGDGWPPLNLQGRTEQ